MFRFGQRANYKPAPSRRQELIFAQEVFDLYTQASDLEIEGTTSIMERIISSSPLFSVTVGRPGISTCVAIVCAWLAINNDLLYLLILLSFHRRNRCLVENKQQLEIVWTIYFLVNCWKYHVIDRYLRKTWKNSPRFSTCSRDRKEVWLAFCEIRW